MGEIIPSYTQPEFEDGAPFGAFSAFPVAIPTSILLWAIIIGIGYIGYITWNYFTG
jgi:hypothetical protein